MAKKIINRGTYCTLVAQLDKLSRHNRQGSFRTKERYYEAFKRFCAYLADEYHLQKLENISGMHLTSYVLWDAGERQVRLHHQDRPGRHLVLPRQNEPAQVSAAFQRGTGRGTGAALFRRCGPHLEQHGVQQDAGQGAG